MAAAADVQDESVAVIIPCYNQAEFLAEAIESAQNQTVPPTEIIVINDGSTDETETVARRYADITYIAQPNAGVVAARDRAVRSSRSRYLIFLDADDRLLPDHIAVSLQAFREHPEAAFVCGDYRVIGLDDLRHRHDCRPRPDHYGTLLQIRANFITAPCVVMFRRDRLDAVGGWDVRSSGPNRITNTLAFGKSWSDANADIDLLLRIAKQYPIHCHHQVVGEYRRHLSQVTKRYDIMLNGIMAVYRRHWPYIKRHPEYVKAYRNGIELTRTACVEPLLWHMAAAARRREWRVAVREAATVARHFPGSLAAFVGAKVGRVIRQASRTA